MNSKISKGNADKLNEATIDGDLLEVYAEDEELTIVSADANTKIAPLESEAKEKGNQTHFINYLLVPFIFLTVAMLGGLRISADSSEFIFWRPALICLVFGAILVVLFFRAGLLDFGGWLNEKFSVAKNSINGLILITLFAASTQVFNALIPEQGLPFWVIAFCFFWTLWTNLFAEFDTRRLFQSLGGLFGLAFIVKYLVLINFVPETSQSWMDIFSVKNVGKEAFAYMLELPNFSGSTGYIQFFTLGFYLMGLFLLKPKT